MNRFERLLNTAKRNFTSGDITIPFEEAEVVIEALQIAAAVNEVNFGRRSSSDIVIIHPEFPPHIWNGKEMKLIKEKDNG